MDRFFENLRCLKYNSLYRNLFKKYEDLKRVFILNLLLSKDFVDGDNAEYNV